MLIVMDKEATPAQIGVVVRKIEALGYLAQPMPGGERVAIAVLRNPGPVDPAQFLDLPGVVQAIPVTRAYKLVSREVKREDTLISLPGLELGRGRFVVMAGPCAVESELQALTIAARVKAAGARIFRGGAFKPRTSPYSHQGLGKPGLKILKKVRDETGLLIVTEAVDEDSLKLVREYADIVQIGARNMQNFSLLRQAGHCGKPVLLKRGMNATLEEWLMAAEYIMAEGNSQIILCERGFGPSASMSAISWTWRRCRWFAGRPISPSWWTPATPPAGGTWCLPWPGPRWSPAATASSSKCTMSRKRPSPTGPSPFTRTSSPP